MSSTSSWSRMTAACVAATMMMMMIMMAVTTDAAALHKAGGQSKHPARPHRRTSDGPEIETVPLQLDSDALVPPKNIRPLENASISPWTYNVSRDDSLYPSMLSEARCLLKGCLDSEGREDLSLQSRPIMHQVLVLRRVQGGGAGHGYHYRLESRLIAVGCTCVRPHILPQQ